MNAVQTIKKFVSVIDAEQGKKETNVLFSKRARTTVATLHNWRLAKGFPRLYEVANTLDALGYDIEFVKRQ